MAKKKKQESLAKSGGIQIRTKVRTFADKVRSKRCVVVCPTCGEEVKTIRYVRSDRGKMFRDSRIQVCRCNREEIYGTE